MFLKVSGPLTLAWTFGYCMSCSGLCFHSDTCLHEMPFFAHADPSHCFADRHSASLLSYAMHAIRRHSIMIAMCMGNADSLHRPSQIEHARSSCRQPHAVPLLCGISPSDWITTYYIQGECSLHQQEQFYEGLQAWRLRSLNSHGHPARVPCNRIWPCISIGLCE